MTTSVHVNTWEYDCAAETSIKEMKKKKETQISPPSGLDGVEMSIQQENIYPYHAHEWNKRILFMNFRCAFDFIYNFLKIFVSLLPNSDFKGYHLKQ